MKRAIAKNKRNSTDRHETVQSVKKISGWKLAFAAAPIAICGIWQVGIGLAQSPSQSVPVVSAVYSIPTGASIPTGSNHSFIVPASAHFSSGSYASASPTTIRNWALDVANAQINLNAARLPDVQAARQRLEQAMSELENFLATSPQHQGNWLAFLTWNDLREQIKKDKPNRQALVQIEKTFRQNYFGLELRQFTNVRDSLKSYVTALQFGTNQSDTMEILNNRLKKLSEQVQMPDFQKDFASTRDIGQTVSYLASAAQATDLVQSVKSNYARANARVLISNDFISRKFGRPVNEPNPVNENILGTQIYGQSLIQGSVTPQLLESPSNAAVRLNLHGNLTSQSIGYNRSVKLHTQGYADVFASETIALTDEGLVPLNDTAVDANLSSQINSIEARLRIVRRIASKKAAQQKPQADAIAEGRLENRLRDQFHTQIAEQISTANQKIKTPEFPALKRFGLEKPKRSTWSSPQYIALLWKVQQGIQFMAPASCPLIVDPSGVTVQLHESLVTNITDPILSGRILSSKDLPALAAQFEELTGKKSVLQAEKEEWSITLDNYHPIELQLDDNLVTFRIRVTKLDRAGQALDQAASIEASYRILLDQGAVSLTRDGDVKINFSGKDQRGVRAASLRSFLKKKFDDVFKVNLLDQPVRLTDKLPAELQGLQLASIQVDDGWIQAHLR
jgi:hypothetical protein